VVNAGEAAVDAVSGAATSAWDWTKNAANWVACRSVDLTVFNFDPCWAAPPSNLCTPDCKAELEKLPQSCVSGRCQADGQQLGMPVAQRAARLPCRLPWRWG
jgi:hypothetical protein